MNLSIKKFLDCAIGNFIVERLDCDFYQLVYIDSYSHINYHYYIEYEDGYNEVEISCEGLLYIIDRFGAINKEEISTLLLNTDKSEIIPIIDNQIAIFLCDPNPLLRKATRDWYEQDRYKTNMGSVLSQYCERNCS